MSARVCARTIAAVVHCIGQPEGQAVDDHNGVRGYLGLKRIEEIQRRFQCPEPSPTLGAVTFDALGHLGIRGFRGSNEDPLPLGLQGKLQRPPALSRSGAADDQGGLHVSYAAETATIRQMRHRFETGIRR